MEGARPTQKSIAAKAGVTQALVSLALSNHPDVAPETRSRILAIAESMGYKPDPYLSGLSAYRKRVQTPTFQGTLAWVTNFTKRNDWHNPANDNYYKGACERAEEMGYRVEEFWLREQGMTAKRASQVLYSRGVRGLLLCPQPAQRGHLSMRWDDFSVVSFGYSMSRPRVHVVAGSYFNSVVVALRHLRAKGHKRIGFACEHQHDERVNRHWSSAFMSDLSVLPESRKIPLFLERQYDAKRFLRWYEKYRPTAIVTSYSLLNPIEWLEDAGYRVPQDVSVAILNLSQPDGNLAGIYGQTPIVGRSGVNLLADMLHRGEHGLPETPLHLLVECVWVEGKSVAKLPR